MNDISPALRIGCVGYLNSLPLVRGLSVPLRFDHPSRLFELMNAGGLDVALLPVAGVLRFPAPLVVDGVGICSDGPVYSVVMAHETPWQDVGRVRLDVASMTSFNLLRVLFAEGGAQEPLYVPATREQDLMLPPGPGEGVLLIGSQAIAYRKEYGDRYRYLDLGEEWKRRTGLPFVFGLWRIAESYKKPAELAGMLRASLERGLAEIPSIAAEQDDPEFALEYLTRNIRFRVGAAEKQAVARFRDCLVGVDRAYSAGGLPQWI